MIKGQDRAWRGHKTMGSPGRAMITHRPRGYQKVVVVVEMRVGGGSSCVVVERREKHERNGGGCPQVFPGTLG